MSLYICNHCDRPCDADYEGCYTDPNDDTELICEECHEAVELEEEV